MFDPYAATFRLLRRSGLLDGLPNAITWTQQRMGALPDAAARSRATREVASKLHLMAVVTTTRVDRGEPLGASVRRALRDREDFLPFVLEGVAFKYFALHPDRDLRTVLAAEGLADLSCPTHLSMLHVGAGMAGALRSAHTYAGTKDRGAARERVIAFLRSCNEGAVDGYGGCMVEPAGLVSLTHLSGGSFVYDWTQLLCESSDGEVPGDRFAHIAHLHHGLGRALYFRPRTLLPSRSTPLDNRPLADLQRVLASLPDRLRDPHAIEIAQRNLVAGLFWAQCAASLGHPDLLLAALQRAHTRPALAPHRPAIAEGIRTNLYMLHRAQIDDAPPGTNALEATFHRYRPDTPSGRDLWERYVTAPFATYVEQVDALDTPLRIDEVYRA